MAGYQDTQVSDDPNGSDPQSDVLSGVTDSAELDGNDGLDLPPLPGIEFNETDPEERDALADRESQLGEIFSPRDDPFDDLRPGGSEEGPHGNGPDRPYGGGDRDGHDSGDASGHDSGDQSGHDDGEADEPDGGTGFGAQTIFGDTGLDELDTSGENDLGIGDILGGETIFGGIDEDHLGGGDILDGASLSDDPNLDGTDGLDVPVGPDIGEADSSSQESLPGSDLLDGLNELGAGMGEDRLVGGGTDTYWSPKDSQGSGDRTEDQPLSDDSDEVRFDGSPPSTPDPDADAESADNPLSIDSLLDADVGSSSLTGGNVQDPAELPLSAPLGLDAFDVGLITGAEILA